MEPTTPPAGIRKTGRKREQTAAHPTSQGRQKRHRPDGQAPPDPFPFEQQQESQPSSINPQEREPYVWELGGDESRWPGSLGHMLGALDTRGVPVNHLGGLGSNLQGVGTSDQSGNYYPPHLSLLDQYARHGHPDAPAGSSSGGGAHSGTAHQEIPLVQGLSQDILPPFVSHPARKRGVGGYRAGGVPGGQPVEARRGSPEEPRASPDDSSSPEDSSAPVVPRGAGVTGTNSVRQGPVSNFQTGNGGGAPSSDASSEENEPSESEDDDSEGDSDELEDDQDDSSRLSQGEDADIELGDAEDVEEESSSEDGQPGFESRELVRRATAYQSRPSRNDGTVESVARTLQASRLHDSDSNTDSSSSSLSSSSSDEDENQRRARDQGYDTADELADEYHRAEFAYDDDDERVNLIRQKYGPPMGGRNSPTPDENTNKGRRTLRPQEREDVKNTRHMGACVRCRMQKIKCYTDQNKPKGECISCKIVNQDSPKIHRFMPCQRLKIADLVLYRCGGLNLTRRWKGIQMRDVSDRVDNIPTVIKVSQGLCRKPLLMKVVRFKPRPGDVTARYWTDSLFGKDVFKKKELASYCLYDIMTTAVAVEKYTVENAVPAFIDTLKDEMDKGEGYDRIHKTEFMALKHYFSLRDKVKAKHSEDDIIELGIMINLFTLWCAIRHTTGSFYIEGEETLGMLPETEDKSYPLLGKVSVPRMIVAQFDTLNYVWVLERYKNKLLRDIDWLLLRNKGRWWFAVYLIVFILLREASWVSLDRYRHARQNFPATLRYSIPFFVESLHVSCNNILAHWHHRNDDKWPESMNPKAKEGTFMSHLTDEQYIIIQETRRDPEVHRQLRVWEVYKNENGKIIRIQPPQDPTQPQYTGRQDKFDWDHPFYWVAQIFEPNWSAHPTYQREPVPKSAAG
ncbi:hypothetical protein CDV31_008305 [Fusarium ambrosium]|uniref:Zn(2)-C6 fungal-type domain-containing protein n=1 Tax=Fusarium ambrosium TaxID=131363 RepID=A0A428U1E3_9HYPO|nr:hypothetical protein CDV31_008305 [Fusarium ambrosium]